MKIVRVDNILYTCKYFDDCTKKMCVYTENYRKKNKIKLKVNLTRLSSLCRIFTYILFYDYLILFSQY